MGGFGAAAAGTRGNASQAVRVGGFADSTTQAQAVRPPEDARAGVREAVGYTPVEILFKPRPTYTAEARSLKVEGEVALQVVFLASGTIRVLRVVRGLGHGLDEAAQQAAEQVRFKPATRGGTPVDTSATIRITFELS